MFLHGFLGQKEDWEPLFAHLPSSFPKQAIDLPGHGKAPFTPDLIDAVHQQVQGAPFLVGYSAGGRIALALKQKYPDHYGRLILLSTHIGPLTAEEKQERWHKDQQWIKLLENEPFALFLERWYEQTCFASLASKAPFPHLLARRKTQDPRNMAAFLHAFSLAKQPAPEIPPEAFFLFGKEDLKYQALYRKLLTFQQNFGVQQAGHALHIEQPKTCAAVIQGVIDANP